MSRTTEMRRSMSTRISACVLVTFMLAACGTMSDVDRGASAISSKRVRSEIDYIASDALQGRNTPSEGLDSAAQYIARAFRRAGVQPVQGKYVQPFKLNIVALGDSNSLILTSASGSKPYALKDDFVPFEITANHGVDAEVVFAGYGITAPAYHYDDYAGIDVHGKIVFVLRHEPGEDDTASAFDGRKATGFSSVATKVRQAREHGAVGVLLATDPLNHTLLTPRGFPWPSLSKIIPKDALPTTLAVEEGEKLPVVHVGEEIIAQCFGSVDSLKALQEAIDKSFTPRSFPLKGIRVRLQTSTAIREMSTQNVVGVVEGSDPGLRGEVVVVGAHYDHVGVKRNAPAGTDSIYNGADDNGSGAVALMEVGAALGAMPRRPLRTVLLIAFAGEEKGLFGSEYYVRKPLFPLDSTVAMLNMDMVGRNAEDSLQVIGSPEGSFLVKTTREENAGIGFALLNTALSSGGSDHQSFEKRNVPVIFYHSGLHPDYHQVSDEAGRISESKIARVAALVFRTVWQAANTHDPLIHPSSRGKK
jgi:hypothetical protein